MKGVRSNALSPLNPLARGRRVGPKVNRLSDAPSEIHTCQLFALAVLSRAARRPLASFRASSLAQK